MDPLFLRKIRIDRQGMGIKKDNPEHLQQNRQNTENAAPTQNEADIQQPAKQDATQNIRPEQQVKPQDEHKPTNLKNQSEQLMKEMRDEVLTPKQLKMNYLASMERSGYVKKIMNLPRTLPELLIQLQNPAMAKDIQNVMMQAIPQPDTQRTDKNKSTDKTDSDGKNQQRGESDSDNKQVQKNINGFNEVLEKETARKQAILERYNIGNKQEQPPKQITNPSQNIQEDESIPNNILKGTVEVVEDGTEETQQNQQSNKNTLPEGKQNDIKQQVTPQPQAENKQPVDNRPQVTPQPQAENKQPVDNRPQVTPQPQGENKQPVDNRPQVTPQPQGESKQPVDNRPQVNPQPQAESKQPVDNRPQVNPQPQAENKQPIDNRPQVNPQPQVENRQPVDNRPQVTPQPQVENKQPVDNRPQVNPQPQAENKQPIDNRPQVNPQPQVENRQPVDNRPQVNPQPQVENKQPVDNRPQVNPQPQVENKQPIDNRPQVNPQPQAENKQPVDNHPQVNPQPQVENRQPVDNRPQVTPQPQAENKQPVDNRPQVNPQPQAENKQPVDNRPLVTPQPQAENKQPVDNRPQVTPQPQVENRQPVDNRPQVTPQPQVENKQPIDNRPQLNNHPRTDNHSNNKPINTHPHHVNPKDFRPENFNNRIAYEMNRASLQPLMPNRMPILNNPPQDPRFMNNQLLNNDLKAHEHRHRPEMHEPPPPPKAENKESEAIANLYANLSMNDMQNPTLSQMQQRLSDDAVELLFRGLINLNELSETIKHNGQDARSKLILAMANASKQGIDNSQLTSTMKLVTESMAAKENDPSSILKNIIMLYLPWYPLQEGVGFNLSIETMPNSSDFSSLLKVYIQTRNYGNVNGSMVLLSSNNVDMNIQCNDVFPKDDLLDRMQDVTKNHSIQSNITVEEYLQQNNDVRNQQAKVNLSSTYELNPFLLLMAHSFIKNTIIIDSGANA